MRRLPGLTIATAVLLAELVFVCLFYEGSVGVSRPELI